MFTFFRNKPVHYSTDRQKFIALRNFITGNKFEYKGVLDRLPQSEWKASALGSIATRINNELLQQPLNGFKSEYQFDDYINRVRLICRQHRDQGIKGFLKLNFLRKTKAEKALDEIFNSKNNIFAGAKFGVKVLPDDPNHSVYERLRRRF